MSVRFTFSINPHSHADWEALAQLTGAPESAAHEARQTEHELQCRLHAREDLTGLIDRQPESTQNLIRFSYMGYKLTPARREALQAENLDYSGGRTGDPTLIKRILTAFNVPADHQAALERHPLILTWD